METLFRDQFAARFDTIRVEIERMLEEAPDRGPLVPGHYWAKAHYWMNLLFKHGPAWVESNFRWLARESLSDGYPGDYSAESPEALARIGARYERYTEGLPGSLWLTEPAFARPWGFEWQGRRISYAIVRLQRCFANLYRAGVFA